MRTAGVIAAVCVAVLALGVSGAGAEMRQGAFNVRPFGGVTVFEGNQDLDTTYTYGLGAGYNITRNLGAEFTFNHADSDAHGNSSEVEAYLYKLDVSYSFLEDGPLVPYVALGGGAVTWDPELGETDTDPLFNWGGGAKYFFNDKVALQADLRHIAAFDDNANNFMGTLGLNFQIGGEPPRRVALEPPPCPDEDNDGVCDDKDKCPGTAPGTEVDADGCCADGDKDGVCDSVDSCLDTAPGAKVNEVGCYLVLKEKVVINLYVQFDFDKATVKPEFHNELKKVADFMIQYPNAKAVLEGHTDNQGTDAYNMRLSKSRADAVRNYLVQNFKISAGRFGVVAFGESRPVATNDNEEGRYKNRRVEAVITEKTPAGEAK
jgi:OOP family OmpA-OmpF porin